MVDYDEFFAPACDSIRNNSFAVGSICSKRMEGASCGCEICILEWVLARRSVCRAAIGICEEWRRNQSV